jgi:tetratricopeptide (TPR) repeat protein
MSLPLARALQAEAEADWHRAAHCYREAESLDPSDHRLPTNRAHALWLADAPLAALSAVNRAISLAPGEALPQRNLGNILRDLNRYEAAETAYARAMELEGHGAPLSAWNRSQTLIGLERYPQAYALAERRLELGDFEGWRTDPCWQGWSLTAQRTQPGRSVQVWSEQGLGDTLQYVRWIPLLLQRGQAVQLVVEACLSSLLREGLAWAGNGLEVRSKEELVGAAAMPRCHGSLLSLPWLLGGAPATGSQPYLRSPHWRRSARTAAAGLRVGVVWASGRKLGEPFMAREYWRRTLPARPLLALLDGLKACAERQGKALEIESLQLGEDRQIAAAWSGGFAAELAADVDFSATARRIASLDLVISVDTATAHLVGAMGHPGWVLLPWGSDPRWLRQRDSSPWYPSLQLLRQPAHRDWDGLVTGVLERFSAWLAAQPTG